MTERLPKLKHKVGAIAFGNLRNRSSVKASAPWHLRLSRCQLATPKEFAPASGFGYRQYPSEHDGRWIQKEMVPLPGQGMSRLSGAFHRWRAPHPGGRVRGGLAIHRAQHHEGGPIKPQRREGRRAAKPQPKL